MRSPCVTFAAMNLPNNIQRAAERATAEIRLDANESPFNTPDNRYPDNELTLLKKNWGAYERIPERCVYFTNGTEEAVDLAMRTLAVPTRDDIIITPPTRSVYERRAAANRLSCREVALNEDDFSLNVEAVLNAVGTSTRIIFLCSPGSPTGNLLSRDSVETLAGLFDGYIIIDESYIDFTPQATLLPLLNSYSNVVILRSFSHAWSAAGLRLASVIAHPEVIEDLTRVGLTHPLSSPVIRAATHLVSHRLDVDKWARRLIDEREKVVLALSQLPSCKKIYPSCTNFILTRFDRPEDVHRDLSEAGISVRLLGEYIRITIGLPNENSALIGALRRRI